MYMYYKWHNIVSHITTLHYDICKVKKKYQSVDINTQKTSQTKPLLPNIMMISVAS